MPKVKKSLPIAEPKHIFDEAEAFSIAADAIGAQAVKYSFKNPDFAHQLVLTSWVNHALAFELYLKCLMGIEKGKFYTGHNLLYLFSKLSKQNKYKIIGYHDNGIFHGAAYYVVHGLSKKTDFMTLLSDASNAFVDYRYMFEGKKWKNYELDFAIRVVREVIIELCPNYIPNHN